MGQPSVRFLVYFCLFAVSIPWYWQLAPALGQHIMRGVPLWVVTSLMGSAAISAYTAWILRQPWGNETEDKA